MPEEVLRLEAPAAQVVREVSVAQEGRVLPEEVLRLEAPAAREVQEVPVQYEHQAQPIATTAAPPVSET